MKSFCGILSYIFFPLSTPLKAEAQLSWAENLKAVSGDGLFTSFQTAIKAIPHIQIIQGDSIKTDPKSSADCIFEDDTVIALRPNSEMYIDNVHKPKNRRVEVVVR